MTMVYVPGEGLWLPRWLHQPGTSGTVTYITTGLLDAATEKFAFVGRFWHPDRAAGHTISKIMFRFGAITKDASTDIQVSLQNVNIGDAFPDETADQAGLVGNANIVSNTIVETTLSSTRTVAQG